MEQLQRYGVGGVYCPCLLSCSAIGSLTETHAYSVCSRSSLLEFSFDRSEDRPLEVMEDIFASYERRK